METKIEKDTSSNEAADAKLLQEARAGLIVAGQHLESGISQDSHEQIRNRVLGVSQTATGQPQLRIDSQRLTLDQKLFIEKILLRHLDLQEFCDIGIYFQKSSGTQSLQNPQASPQPSTQAERSSPLGLNLRKQPIPSVKHVILVASGKGGVGKSTISANLAAGLAAQGIATGLMDCDVYGPSSPMMLGIDGPMNVDQGKLVPRQSHGVKVVSFGFLNDVRSPVIWRGPMVGKAIEQLCFDVLWGELDALIIDLPPGTGDVQLTLAERIPVTTAVIVTTPQDIALIDAHKAVSMFEKLAIPVAGVVENMAIHTCSNCGHEEHIFGQEAFELFLRSRNLRRLAQIPLDKSIRESGDAGTPIVLSEKPSAKPYKKLTQEIVTLHFSSLTKGTGHSHE